MTFIQHHVLKLAYLRRTYDELVVKGSDVITNLLVGLYTLHKLPLIAPRQARNVHVLTSTPKEKDTSLWLSTRMTKITDFFVDIKIDMEIFLGSLCMSVTYL